MRAPVKNHVRDALLTAALFGGIGVAFAQPPKPADESGVFVNGRLNVPNAPADTSTTPSTVSQRNAKLDKIPIMARGPELTDAQRKLILERVMATGGSTLHVDASPSSALPADIEMQAWPADILGEVPAIRDTKYVKLSDKVLLVRPESRIVVGEIGK